MGLLLGDASKARDALGWQPKVGWSLFMTASGIMLAYLVVTLSGNFRLATWLVAAVAATYVFLFGIGGAKAAILSLVYLPLVYGLMTQPRNRIPHLFVAGLCVSSADRTFRR